MNKVTGKAMRIIAVPMLKLKEVQVTDGEIVQREFTVTREPWLWDSSETCHRCNQPIGPDDLVLVMDYEKFTPRRVHRMCLEMQENKTFAAWEAAREHRVLEGRGACDPGIDCKDCVESAETEDLPAWEGEANGQASSRT